MLKCQDIAEYASDYLDDELPLRKRMAVRLHLWMCRDCRAFISNFRRSIDILNRHSSDLAPVPESLIQRIETSVELQLREDGAGQPGRADVTSPAAPREEQKQPRLRVVEGTGGNARVERIFREIEQVQGSVSNLFRAYAHHPDVLEVTWNRVKAIMLSGSLPRKLKETIAVMISSDNGCQYCVEHHTRALRSLGVADDEVRRLLRDPLAGNFAPKERALLALARQANRDPHGASDEHIEVARRAGATDAEIIEALAVMELFTSFNRFLDTLNIPLEQA